MSRNIVICSDGTGNTFADGVSNVSHLVRRLDLAGNPRSARQIAFYDQGIGTNSSLIQPARDFKARAGRAAESLTILDPPSTRAYVPARLARWAGMAFGWGLEENVFQIVQALSASYREGDRIYLFGFSRGAFTVRVVAGLLYRCGLPPGAIADFPAWFAEAYKLYEPHERSEDDERAFRKHHDCRTPEVEFMGLWDTVKSYGGLRPISLPHLRHNPIVRTVRHALALHEKRAWFAHTTWGHLQEPMTGIPIEHDRRYAGQSIQEVWFRGAHSDVGGGDEEWRTARAPLRWMLAEAAHAGLRLNDEGWALLHEPDADDAAASTMHESYDWRWQLLGAIPRIELFNDRRPPRREWSWLHPKKTRDPMAPDWSGKIALCHASAVDCWRGGRMKTIATVPPERPRDALDS